MKKIIIGIVGRAGIYDNKPIIYINESLRRLVYQKNCIPLLIMPCQDINYFSEKSSDILELKDEEKELIIYQIDRCDGIIIPGGNRQFEYDKFIYKYALNKNLPILGICMGMQLMCNVDNELKVKRDVPIKNSSSIKHECDNHDISILKSSKLFKILKSDRIIVNSFHNYHIEKVNNLKISARSYDGYIEAVENSDKNFVIGVQWHPEKIMENNECNEKIINEFIIQAKEVSNGKGN